MADPLPLGGLHHLSRQVSDVERSRAFYRDVLGFAEIQRPDLKFNGAWLENYGIQVHLIGDQDFDPEDKGISSRANHTAFHSGDLERTEQLLREHGVDVKVNIQSGTGNKQLFCHDPDGHTIEIATYPGR